MGLPIRAKFEPLRSLAFGSISSSYASLGSALSNPASFVALKNLSDTTLLFSLDGTEDHVVLPPNGFQIIDVTSNKSNPTGLYFSKGTQIYVKDNGSAASSGDAYAEVIYGEF